MAKKSTDDGAAPKKATKKKAPSKGGDAPLPPFGDIDEKALKKLAAGLAKKPKNDQYKVSKLVRDVNGGNYGTVADVLWHLVEHGAIEAEAMPGVLSTLEEKAEAGKPEVIFNLLARMGRHLGKTFEGWTEYVPGVPGFVDRLMVTGWTRDSDLFESRSGELDPRLRLELAFVRARFERPIEPADAAAIFEHLARQLARGEMTGNQDLAMSKGGEPISHRLDGPAGLLEVARRFGTEEEYHRKVVAHALHVEQPHTNNLMASLQAAPLDDVVEIFAHCYSWGDSANCERELAFLEGRKDTPEELMAAAEGLVPGKVRGKYDNAPDDPEGPTRQRAAVRDNLLALAAARFAAEGKPVPARFEELYRFEALSDIYHPTIRRHLAAFAALPRDRALALADRRMAEDYGYSPAVVVLAAHPDDERLKKLFDKDRANGYLAPRYLGLHGPSIIPLIEAEMDKVPKDRRRYRHEAILFALAEGARTKAAVDPAWAAHVRWDTLGGEDYKYWNGSTDTGMRDDALDAFEPSVVRAALLRSAREEAYPLRVLTSRHVGQEDRELVTAIVDEVVKREGSRSNSDQLRTVSARLGAGFVDALIDSIGRLGADAAFIEQLKNPLSYKEHQRLLESLKGKLESIRDMFVRTAGEAPGPKRRVYALDQDGEKGFVAKEGSFSRLGGSVPGLSEGDYPKHEGDPMTPILTLDLDEIPELQKRYPEARLLVLFHPDPEGGEDQESAELVPVPRAAVVEAGDGGKLAVTPVDLPEAVFAERAERERLGPEVQALRKLLFQRGGHVFGEPFWIQDDEAGSDGFLFQLNDGLCDLNLGDVGSFYAFEGGLFVFQCH